MPGPVSDSFDPEWGTSAKCEEISDALGKVYNQLCGVLLETPPIDIRILVNAEMRTPITATLSERQWRLLRFSVERARESL